MGRYWLALTEHKTSLVLKLNFFISGNISAKIRCWTLHTSGTRRNRNRNCNSFQLVCPLTIFWNLIRPEWVFKFRSLRHFAAFIFESGGDVHFLAQTDVKRKFRRQEEGTINICDIWKSLTQLAALWGSYSHLQFSFFQHRNESSLFSTENLNIL